MFPLKSRKLIRGYEAHIAAGLGGGADYVAVYVPFTIPFDGTVIHTTGPQGGLQLKLTRPGGDRIELLHLKSIAVPDGPIKAGAIGGVTGNSGHLTPGAPPYAPHLHIQIFDKWGKRLDPEKYLWETTIQTTFMKITVVANKNNWTTLPEQVTKLAEMFKTYSSGRLEIVADIRKTSFTNIPLAPLAGAQAIDVNWYRQNVTPLATGQLTVFTMNPEDYHNGTTWGFMSYGDPNKPVRCEISPVENLPDQYGTPHFAKQAFHEICHALLFLTGQTDRVHELIYQDPPGYKAILDLIDYQKLQEALIKIKGDSMSQAKVVKSKNSPTVYICYPVPSATHLNERASLEGIQIPNPIPNSDIL